MGNHLTAAGAVVAELGIPAEDVPRMVGRVAAVLERFFPAAPAPSLAPLTPKQLRVLQAFEDYYRSAAVWPTIEEVADVVGTSKVTVFEHMRALVNKGYMVAPEGKAARRAYTIAPGVVVPRGRVPAAG